jgi:hypothetical protein
MGSRLVPLLVVAALWPTARARADCAMPLDYALTEAPAGRVQICLRGTLRTCSTEASQGLLRLDETSGEVVRLSACTGDCFLDECVPAGTYQYGLALPFACDGSACFTRYYEEIHVGGPAGECARAGPAPVVVDAGVVPWTIGQQDVCTYHRWPGGSGYGCGLAPHGAVLGTNLAFALVGLLLWRRRPGRRPRP